MNTLFPVAVPIGEIARTYAEGPHPLDQKYNLRCGGGGAESDGSPVSSPMTVPGSAVLFMAPHACGRHNSIGAFAMGRKDRIWYMRLEERDIVSGLNAKRAKEALLEMARTCESRPQVIFLCVTCVDMLLASDYRAVAAQVEAETGIRIGRALMCPLLNESKTPDPTRTWNFVSELLRTEAGAPKEPTINLIGNYNRPEPSSDLCLLLAEAGIPRVNHFVGCKDLAEMDRMGQASWALSFNSAGELACRNMDKRFGIPHGKVLTSFDPDVIHGNYETISRLTGKKIDDGAWYEKTKARMAEVAAKCAGKSIVVGESLDNDPFRAAAELCRLGFPVSAVFTRFIKPEYRENVLWLAENRPELKVYFSAHPGMFGYPGRPDHFDLALGLDSSFTAADKSIVTVSGAERQPDYSSVLAFLDRVEQAIEGTASANPSLMSMLGGKGPKVLGYTGTNKKVWGHYRSAMGGKE